MIVDYKQLYARNACAYRKLISQRGFAFLHIASNRIAACGCD